MVIALSGRWGVIVRKRSDRAKGASGEQVHYLIAGEAWQGDGDEVRISYVPDVEHSWLLRAQHTTFAHGSDPAGKPFSATAPAAASAAPVQSGDALGDCR